MLSAAQILVAALTLAVAASPLPASARLLAEGTLAATTCCGDGGLFDQRLVISPGSSIFDAGAVRLLTDIDWTPASVGEVRTATPGDPGFEAAAAILTDSLNGSIWIQLPVLGGSTGHGHNECGLFDICPETLAGFRIDAISLTLVEFTFVEQPPGTWSTSATVSVFGTELPEPSATISLCLALALWFTWCEWQQSL